MAPSSFDRQLSAKLAARLRKACIPFRFPASHDAEIRGDVVDGSGERVFNLAINGTSVLSNFDIYAAAGGADIAVDRTFSVNSTGTVTIQFIPGSADEPKIDAVEVQ